MPHRRGLAGLGAGVGAGLADVGELLMRDTVTKKREQRGESRALFKDLFDRVAKGELEPEQAEAEMTSLGYQTRPGAFTHAQPSVESELRGLVTGITKAGSTQEVPTDEALKATFPRRLPLRTLGEPGAEGPIPEDDAYLSREFKQVQQARDAKLRMFAPEAIEEYIPGTGERRRSYVASDPRTLTGQQFQIQPTTEQEGAAKARVGELLRPGEIETQRQKTEVEARTRQPFEQAMARYRKSLDDAVTAIQTVNDPRTGEDRLVLVDRRTGKATPVDLPAGLEAGRGRPIPATVADNVAGANAAEVEAVKILRSLRQSGLDQSNDPLDPRIQKFLINTLRMAPEDAVKGDIQQRTGFVNASLTRALMGSRPSQYVAKEIIQPHLPQQNATGKQLARVIENVLQQAGERRAEFAHTLGVPYERLAPTKGSYAEYLRELGIDTTLPAQLTLDPSGKLVPTAPRRP